MFDPIGQGRRFDPDGAYLRRWLPELKALPLEHLHAPFAAPPEVLTKVRYPRPVVDHAAARLRFIQVAKRHLTRPR